MVRTLERRANRTLLTDLHGDHWQKSFVVNHFRAKEIWICYPGGRLGSNASEVPDKALVWNYSEDTLAFRDLPKGSTWLTRGIIEGEGEQLSWDTDLQSWDSDETEWNEESVQRHSLLPVTFIPTGMNRGLIQMDVANIDPLTPRRSGSIERRNLCYLPNRRTKEPMLDIESERILTVSYTHLTLPTILLV